MVDTVLVIAGQACNRLNQDHGKDNDESAENDCTAHPEAFTAVPIWERGADCKGEDEKAISKEEDRP